ncbi:MAG: putative mycofactocin-associated electron transfer flavoprotein [Acidimicrobiales bacterium mtb01]|nr:putative mycofactocin-associated electron transfer flavoprotein [Actinomycetota bacterium]TEX46426.1 MAG: putative mycofactocin-associated electron transfer flavoprotein [Acidimicrobiales bacterium mtb01]
MTVVACLKWVIPRVDDDDRFAGISAADQSALEFALLSARPGEDVVAVSAGPLGAERALRDAVACGLSRAIRIDLDPRASSSAVASSIASAVAGARLVWCGDYSLDRGTGSMPGFLAARLGIGQALGLIDVTIGDDSMSVVRRLDGARREIMRVTGPAVLSVEGSTARLRRASLRGVLAADNAIIDVIAGMSSPIDAVDEKPYRPRARALAAPSGTSALDRVRSLTDAGTATQRSETVVLDPPEAAARIVGALRDWGYLG